MRNSTMDCRSCGKFTGPYKRYCSDACKQVAYRDRQRAKNQPIMVPCEKCNVMYLPKSGKSRYCSPACKQAAYRNRKSNVEL